MNKYLIILVIIGVTFQMCKQEAMEHTQWEQDDLELPKMIRQPNEIDIPKSDSMYNIWIERKSIVLHEGYTIAANESKDSINFNFYSEININNSNLYKLFISLIESIEGEAYIVYKTHDADQIFYCNQKLPIKKIKENLEEFRYDITNNCSLDIGVVYNEDRLIEVYVDESKFIKYWGVDEIKFKDIMELYKLKEFKSLNFVDQYPKIVYDLNFIEENRLSNLEFSKRIQNKFN